MYPELSVGVAIEGVATCPRLNEVPSSLLVLLGVLPSSGEMSGGGGAPAVLGDTSRSSTGSFEVRLLFRRARITMTTKLPVTNTATRRAITIPMAASGGKLCEEVAAIVVGLAELVITGVEINKVESTAVESVVVESVVGVD